jgi:amino acid transporter
VGGGAATVPTAFITVFAPNSALLWFIAIGLFIGNIGWSWLALIFISRLVMAWSFDRILPSSLANVSDRYHTPYTAIMLTSAVAIIPMYLFFFTSYIATEVNAVFLYCVVWFLTAVSAIILPFRRKTLFDASAGNTRVGGMPIISILGIVGAILFVYLGYNSVTNAAVGIFAQGAQILTVIVVVFPIVLYAASYYYNKSRGIDLRQVCAQLPPD